MRSLRIVIADGGLVPRAQLLTLAEAAGFEVVGEATTWDTVSDLAATRSADLLLVSGPPEFARAGAAASARAAALIVVPDAAGAKEYADAPAFAVVLPDAPPEVVAVTAASAVARAADLVAARREAEQLRDQLETRKVVERAKGVLMRRLGLTEDAAYRKMQKASQDENRRMRDIAESILSAERLYGNEPGAQEPRGARDASGAQEPDGVAPA